MISPIPPWISEDEVVFHRMETFHRQRAIAIAEGESALGKRDDGFLVAHFIPQSAGKGRERFDGSALHRFASSVRVSAEVNSYSVSRFNADGVLKLDDGNAAESYCQMFRDGCMESVISSIIFQTGFESTESGQQRTQLPKFLQDAKCEQAMFRFVEGYQTFCRGIGITSPITVFSALVGCRGVRFNAPRAYRGSLGEIDRSPTYLPEIEITDARADPEFLFRPWCDLLFQSLGVEKSLNYDQYGNWAERQR